MFYIALYFFQTQFSRAEVSRTTKLIVPLSRFASRSSSACNLSLVKWPLIVTCIFSIASYSSMYISPSPAVHFLSLPLIHIWEKGTNCMAPLIQFSHLKIENLYPSRTIWRLTQWKSVNHVSSMRCHYAHSIHLFSSHMNSLESKALPHLLPVLGTVSLFYFDLSSV